MKTSKAKRDRSKWKKNNKFKHKKTQNKYRNKKPKI